MSTSHFKELVNRNNSEFVGIVLIVWLSLSGKSERGLYWVVQKVSTDFQGKYKEYYWQILIYNIITIFFSNQFPSFGKFHNSIFIKPPRLIAKKLIQVLITVLCRIKIRTIKGIWEGKKTNDSPGYMKGEVKLSNFSLTIFFLWPKTCFLALSW